MTLATLSASPMRRIGTVVSVSPWKAAYSLSPKSASLLDEVTLDKLVAYSKGQLSAMGMPVSSSVILNAAALMVALSSVTLGPPQVAADGEGGLDVEARLNETMQLSLHVTEGGFDGVVQRRGTLEAIAIEAESVESTVQQVRNAAS